MQTVPAKRNGNHQTGKSTCFSAAHSKVVSSWSEKPNQSNETRCSLAREFNKDWQIRSSSRWADLLVGGRRRTLRLHHAREQICIGQRGTHFGCQSSESLLQDVALFEWFWWQWSMSSRCTQTTGWQAAKAKECLLLLFSILTFILDKNNSGSHSFFFLHWKQQSVSPWCLLVWTGNYTPMYSSKMTLQESGAYFYKAESCNVILEEYVGI